VKKIPLIAAIAAIVLVLAAGGIILKKRKAAAGNVALPAIVPAVVDTLKTELKPVTLTLPALAEVTSDVSAILASKLSARIMTVSKAEGSAVKKGELVVVLDDLDLKSRASALAIQQNSIDLDVLSKKEAQGALEVNLSNLNQSHGRTRELMQVKGASIEQFQDEETRIALLKSQIESAKSAVAMLKNSRDVAQEAIREIANSLSYTRLVSPIDGTVSIVYAHEGELAQPGKPLAKITGKSGMVLNVRLPADILSREVIFADRRMALTAKQISNAGGLREYRAALPVDVQATEGDYVNIDIVTFSGEAVLIPFSAVLSINEGNFVFLYDGKTAIRQPVNPMFRGSQGIIFKEDLTGKTLLSAMPDILLRVSAGVPVTVKGQG
jgi:multidrug efflux pump subunit AcrA (membrane-fusion protein)